MDDQQTLMVIPRNSFQLPQTDWQQIATKWLADCFEHDLIPVPHHPANTGGLLCMVLAQSAPNPKSCMGHRWLANFVRGPTKLLLSKHV